ncbi:MAG: substrate-binding domain-containing protein [Verrucomicrobia bacterium]|nr:substrate-binding domain-containing protein [Verrucomicrobiota bacterium]
MTNIPQRISLVSQTAAIIRRDLQRGVWRDYLPGEIPLCRRLQVGRVTLRAALALIGREGLLKVSQGKRRRILCKRSRKAFHSGPKRVVVLCAFRYHELSPFVLFLISELQGQLHAAGYQVEVHADPCFGSRNSIGAVKKLMNQVHADCWVLMGADAVMQEWFAKLNAPTVLVGSLQRGVALPCVGGDYQAVARHAAGLFLARGRRRIALVAPKLQDPAVDDPLRKGFFEAFLPAAHHSDCEPVVLYHQATVNNIQSVLAIRFKSNNPPHAILVSRPRHAITVMSCLMRMGIHLPRDVALISLGHIPALDEMVPSVAHYSINWVVFSKTLSRMALRALRAGALAPRQTLIMPQFHPGETLGAACNY